MDITKSHWIIPALVVDGYIFSQLPGFTAKTFYSDKYEGEYKGGLYVYAHIFSNPGEWLDYDSFAWGETNKTLIGDYLDLANRLNTFLKSKLTIEYADRVLYTP